MPPTIEFSVRYSRVGPMVEAYCPEFDSGACGTDAREALNRLLDKVDRLVVERFGDGGLWERLAASDSNYRMTWDPIWHAPVKVVA